MKGTSSLGRAGDYAEPAGPATYLIHQGREDMICLQCRVPKGTCDRTGGRRHITCPARRLRAAIKAGRIGPDGGHHGPADE